MFLNTWQALPGVVFFTPVTTATQILIFGAAMFIAVVSGALAGNLAD
ncbi:MAG TPA: hypothetical protein VK789_34955 [Bryobacteraceae bacterium]|jgi:hypothetical protein|nr:hypothetical protein [Bryobacteraceae bacterium]